MTIASKTINETYEYYKEGKSIEEIAELRNLAWSTVYGHIASLISNGKIKLEEIVNKSKSSKILQAVEEIDFEGLKELKEYLGESFSYGEIKCVLASIKIPDKELNALDKKSNPYNKISKSNIFTVRELTRYLKNLFEKDKKLNDLFVQGEISNLINHSSGHIYFNLKDEKSQIVVKGSLEIYEPRGEYSIIVEEIQPAGLGALHLAFIQLKNKLEKEGLFLKENKKSLPNFPKVIGIITSSTGAALQDILKVIKKRYPLVKIIIIPTLVQGKESASSIVNSIKLMNEIKNIDVAIVGRGGGSIEDLWSFNEEIVARAIFESKVPILSAVGHETDFTIADFVADERSPTPSAAAERIVPDIIEIWKNLNHLEKRANKSFYYKLKLCKSNLEQINEKYMFKKFMEIINSNYQELDQIKDQIELSILNQIKLEKNTLEIIKSKVIVLNPMNVLKRGYSIVKDGNKILTSSLDIEKGKDINIVLSKGRLGAEVKKIWKK
jgi:exodeoxyribonuclease VII large subunit